MKKPHPKYKIKEGDSISSISSLFGIEESVWLTYHNNMCRLTDIIRQEIPSHLEYVFLLPELWDKEDDLNNPKEPIHPLFNEKQRVALFQNRILFFAPCNINNTYGVIVNFDKNQVHYEIEVKFIEQLTPEVFRLSIDRKQVYINNQEPDGKLYEMADQMAKSIYPIIIDINKEKKIVAIANHNEIRQRCDETRGKLSQYYVGEYAQKKIRLFETQVNNPNSLINHLENELFYQLFFLPIRGIYNDGLIKKDQYLHRSNTHKITTYNLNIVLNENYTESGKIVAKIHSDEKINTERCFDAEYRLYPEDHSIFSMRGSLILSDDRGKPHSTRFEIYHLNTNERVLKKVIPRPKVVSLDEKKSNIAKKKKSFWDIFK